MIWEYTIITIFAVTFVVIIDILLGTKLVLQPRFWKFWLIIVVLHTVVDNYLNGRWFANEPIVGPYDPTYYSGIRIWHTPLENYFFGFALITLNLVLYERLKKSNHKDD